MNDHQYDAIDGFADPSLLTAEAPSINVHLTVVSNLKGSVITHLHLPPATASLVHHLEQLQQGLDIPTSCMIARMLHGGFLFTIPETLEGLVGQLDTFPAQCADGNTLILKRDTNYVPNLAAPQHHDHNLLIISTRAGARINQEVLKSTVREVIQEVAGFTLSSLKPMINKVTDTMTGQNMATFTTLGDAPPTRASLLLFKPRVAFTTPDNTPIFIRVCKELCVKFDLCGKCNRSLAYAGNPSECTCSTAPPANGNKRQRDEARAAGFQNLKSLQRTG